MRADSRTQTRQSLWWRPVGLTGGLALGAALGWVVIIDRRQAAMGMGMGAGVGSVDRGAFLVVWGGMVAAMMLPTIQPMARTYTALVRNEPTGRRRSLTAAFLAPYGALWLLAGAVALVLWTVGRDHPVAAGTLVGTAGLYQLGAVKARCLRWCRSPLGFLMRFGGNARSLLGALGLGTRHGAVCFGCCAGLMVGLTGAGVMSISWLVAVGLLMLLEKTHRAGPALAKASGIVLVALGAATALLPLQRLTTETTGLIAAAALGAVALAASRPRLGLAR